MLPAPCTFGPHSPRSLKPLAESHLYMTHLSGKVAFVVALLYVGRSSMEIQHALLSKIEKAREASTLILILSKVKSNKIHYIIADREFAKF